MNSTRCSGSYVIYADLILYLDEKQEGEVQLREIFKQKSDYYYTEKDNCPFCMSNKLECLGKGYNTLDDIKYINKGLMSWSQNYKCRSCGKLFTKHKIF